MTSMIREKIKALYFAKCVYASKKCVLLQMHVTHKINLPSLIKCFLQGDYSAPRATEWG